MVSVLGNRLETSSNGGVTQPSSSHECEPRVPPLGTAGSGQVRPCPSPVCQPGFPLCSPGKALSMGRSVLQCQGAVSPGVLFVQDGWGAQALGCGYPSVIVCLPCCCWVWKRRSGSICLKFKSQLARGAVAGTGMLSGGRLLTTACFPWELGISCGPAV